METSHEELVANVKYHLDELKLALKDLKKGCEEQIENIKFDSKYIELKDIVDNMYDVDEDAWEQADLELEDYIKQISKLEDELDYAEDVLLILEDL